MHRLLTSALLLTALFAVSCSSSSDSDKGTNGLNADSTSADVSGLNLPEEGFLISFSGGEAGYQTWFISSGPDSLKVEFIQPVVVTPQASGFAYMYGIRTHTEEIIENEPDDWDYFGKMRKDEYEYDQLFTLKKKPDFVDIEKQIETAVTTVAPNCDTCNNWYDYNYVQIGYVVPGHVTLNYGGSSYMGGAHPNHYDGTSTFTFSSFPKELNMSNESNQTGWKDLRQSDWEDIAANGRNGSLPEDIKRELIIEGRHSIFIDRLDEEPDPIDMNDFKNVDLDEIKGDGMYEDVNVQELDAFMYREDGSLKIAVQAHTFASYAESGDYQFTAEAEAGLVSGKISAGNAEWADAEKWMKKAEKGVDAFKSPSGKLIFVWTNEELIAYAADGEKEVFRKKVPGMSSVIQAEWATGKFVAKWAEAGK